MLSRTLSIRMRRSKKSDEALLNCDVVYAANCAVIAPSSFRKNMFYHERLYILCQVFPSKNFYYYAVKTSNHSRKQFHTDHARDDEDGTDNGADRELFPVQDLRGQ